MHMRIFFFLFLAHAFVACQNGPTKHSSVATDHIALASFANNTQAEPTRTSASNLIFQSSDGGQTWQDVSIGLPEGMDIGCIFANEGEVILGSGKGIYRSSPAPAPATPVWNLETSINEPVSNIFPSPSGLFAYTYYNGLFKEVMPGMGVWLPVFNELKDKFVRTIFETSDKSIFAGCDNGIFKSTDNGVTWNQVFSGGMVNSIAYSNSTMYPNGVLVGSGNKGVLRSIDGGETWDWVFTEDGRGAKVSAIDGGFVAFSTGGNTPDEFEVGAHGFVNKVRASTDGGNTWQRIDTQLLPATAPDQAPRRRFIQDVEQVGKYLFCSHFAGISRSSDGGKTWELVRSNTDNQQWYRLISAGQMIYAVAFSGGC